MNSSQALLARADLVRFLAACFYQPGPEFSEEGVFESMQACAALLDPELESACSALGQAFAGAPNEDLLVDYTRLFLGPIQAPALPYASVWLTSDKQLYAEETNAVIAAYEAAGFEIDEGFRDLPDHIAAELEFLYLLLHREYARSADAAAPAPDPEAQAWMTAHLARWTPAFFDAIATHANTDFYRRLAEAARLILARALPAA